METHASFEGEEGKPNLLKNFLVLKGIDINEVKFLMVKISNGKDSYTFGVYGTLFDIQHFLETNHWIIIDHSISEVNDIELTLEEVQKVTTLDRLQNYINKQFIENSSE